MAFEDKNFFFEAFNLEPMRLTRAGQVVVPGGDIPFNFDPLENLLENDKNIAVTTANPEMLLRWYPGTRERQLGSCATDVDVIMDVTDEHFAFLEDTAGLTIVPRDTILGRAPDGDHLAIYNVVPRLKGKNMEEIDEPALVVEQFAQPLLEYYDWVLGSQQAYYLNDLGLRRQYMLGKLSASEANKVYLVDIDPRVKEAASDTGNEWLRRDLFQFRNELATMGFGHLALEQCLERIEDLLDRL